MLLSALVSHLLLLISTQVFVLGNCLELGLVLCLCFLLPFGVLVTVGGHVLDLLDLQDNRDIELVEFSHLLLLEVPNLLFSLAKLHIDVLLLGLHSLSVAFKVSNVDTDLLLVIVQGQALISELFDFVEFEILLLEVGNGGVLILVLLLLLVFFLLFTFAFFVVFIGFFFLNLFDLAAFLGDSFVEALDLNVLVASLGAVLVESDK